MISLEIYFLIFFIFFQCHFGQNMVYLNKQLKNGHLHFKVEVTEFDGPTKAKGHFLFNQIHFRSMDLKKSENEDTKQENFLCDRPTKNASSLEYKCCLKHHFAGKLWNICINIGNSSDNQMVLQVKMNDNIVLDKFVKLDEKNQQICYTFSVPQLQTHCIKFRRQMDASSLICLDFIVRNFLYPINEECRQIGCFNFGED